MINSKYFFQGFNCIKKFDSPAIALGTCFIAIGSLLKNLGFNMVFISRNDDKYVACKTKKSETYSLNLLFIRN